MNIPLGRDNAITYGELAERLNVPRRSVEKAVRDMRLNGIPVVTGNEGAWIATSPQEAREAASRLRARGIHIYEAAAALETWAEIQELSGQEAFPWAA